MTAVRVQFTGLSELQASLLELGQNLPELLLPANEEIAANTRDLVAELYPNMGQGWQVTVNGSTQPQGIASVTAKSDNIYVIWYEFGTARHEIDPVNMQYLKFPGTHGWEGSEVFATAVDHPGAVAHDRSGALMADLADTARSIWTEELTAIFNNLSTGA